MRNNTPHQEGSGGAESPVFDTRAREELILGKPPRIPPLHPSQLDKETSETAAALRRAVASARRMRSRSSPRQCYGIPIYTGVTSS
jgi:hypothetical protein